MFPRNVMKIKQIKVNLSESGWIKGLAEHLKETQYGGPESQNL